MALGALEFYYDLYKEKVDANVITAIKEALAQPKQEPEAWQVKYRNDEGIPQIAWFPHPVHPKSPLAKRPYTEEPLYTIPPQRKPLPPQSPCEMTQAEGKMFKLGWLECEAAHGIKGE